ncbi:Potassium voltage-gated channel subfamily KQT member 1, partial [Araneus ventricosus]
MGKFLIEAICRTSGVEQNIDAFPIRIRYSTIPPRCWTPWEAVYAFRQGRKLVKPTFQGRVYNFLERPKEWKSILYHSAIYTSILGSLFLSVLATVAENKSVYSRIVYVVEVVLVSIFTIEYTARFWSSGCRSKYLGLYGRLRFASKPICII